MAMTCTLVDVTKVTALDGYQLYLQEDYLLAVARLEENNPRVSLKEMEEYLGLKD